MSPSHRRLTLRAIIVVGCCSVVLVGLTWFLGSPSLRVDRLAVEPPAKVSDVPVWERTYWPDEVSTGRLDGSGELERVHVISYVDGALDGLVLDHDREPKRPIERGCGPEAVRLSSFVAPSGRMSVPEPFPVTVAGVEGLAPEDVARQIGIDDVGPQRFGIEQEIEVEPYERVEVRAFPLEERWAFRLSQGRGASAAPRVGVSMRVVGLCFAIFRLA